MAVWLCVRVAVSVSLVCVCVSVCLCVFLCVFLQRAALEMESGVAPQLTREDFESGARGAPMDALKDLYGACCRGDNCMTVRPSLRHLPHRGSNNAHGPSHAGRWMGCALLTSRRRVSVLCGCEFVVLVGEG